MKEWRGKKTQETQTTNSQMADIILPLSVVTLYINGINQTLNDGRINMKTWSNYIVSIRGMI